MIEASKNLEIQIFQVQKENFIAACVRRTNKNMILLKSNKENDD